MQLPGFRKAPHSPQPASGAGSLRAPGAPPLAPPPFPPPESYCRSGAAGLRWRFGELSPAKQPAAQPAALVQPPTHPLPVSAPGAPNICSRASGPEGHPDLKGGVRSPLRGGARARLQRGRARGGGPGKKGGSWGDTEAGTRAAGVAGILDTRRGTGQGAASPQAISAALAQLPPSARPTLTRISSRAGGRQGDVLKRESSGS